jgi:hypothetical protein
MVGTPLRGVRFAGHDNTVVTRFAEMAWREKNRSEERRNFPTSQRTEILQRFLDGLHAASFQEYGSLKWPPAGPAAELAFPWFQWTVTTFAHLNAFLRVVVRLHRLRRRCRRAPKGASPVLPAIGTSVCSEHNLSPAVRAYLHQ